MEFRTQESGRNDDVVLDMKNVVINVLISELETVKLVVLALQVKEDYTGDSHGQLQDGSNIMRCVMVGGGHGGPRHNSGRKVHSKGVDWKLYHKPGKKEMDKIKKSNKNIKDFFSKASVSKAVSDQDKTENDIDKEDVVEQQSDQDKTENDIDKDDVVEQQSDIYDSCMKSPDDQMDANNNDDENKNRNRLPNITDLKKSVLEGQNLAFFHNGCFASKKERLSQTGSNYTCAIDAIIALGEALLLSGNDNSIAHAIDFSLLLLEIKSVLVWRLENDFKWTHSLRNKVWELLATYFPAAICPIGKVTAVIEPGVQEIEKLWYLEVIVETKCSEAGCDKYLGRFRVVSEQLVLSSPMKGELKDKDYTLSELFLNTFSNHVNNILRHKVRCSKRECAGLAMHTGILPENLKVPPFLFFNFHLMGSASFYYNDLKDSCVLEQNLLLGETSLNLLCGLMSSQLHFFTISNIWGKYFKFDNMFEEPTAKGYSSFKEAYNSKVCTSSESNEFHLNRKSVKPRKGAVYFALYRGEDRSEEVERDWSAKIKNTKTLNDMPNLVQTILEDTPDDPVPEEAFEDGDLIMDTDFVASTVGDGPEDIDTDLGASKAGHGEDDIDTDLKACKAGHGDNDIDTDLGASKASEGDEDIDTNLGASKAAHGDDDIDTDLGACKAAHGDDDIDTDLGASGDGDNDIDKDFGDTESDVNIDADSSSDVAMDEEDVSLDKEDVALDEEDDALDEVQACEDHNSKCRLDYRLRTFQDIGRYMSNNCGSYYDHSENLWFCSICQHFSGRRKEGRAWVDKGVRLGAFPGRVFSRHFNSDFHRKNVEYKNVFGNMRREGKSSHIMELFEHFSNGNQLDRVAENRNVIKILFRTSHFIIKKMMPNHTYPELVKLISKCGADALKKFIIKSPKNATYLSSRTFANILKVLNDYTEEPVIKSFQESSYVTLFQDETTDISNHSESVVFAMFSHNGVHKEHYMGIVHMSDGLTAEKFYTSTLNLFQQKNIDISKVQFVDLDGCNTNSGRFQGFHLYFHYHNPHCLHQICNSHTLALIFKHLVVDSRFRPVSDADKLMVNLYVLFKASSVRLSIFEKSQIILEDKVLKLVCPSATRWLSHEHCFSRIMEVYEATLTALAHLYEDRGDIDALGLLIQLSDPKFVLTALMLVDTLGIIRPLTLWLQSSPATADATQLPIMVENVVNRLNYISKKDASQKYKFSEIELESLQFNKDNFAKNCEIISRVIETLPAASRLRGCSQRHNPEEEFEEFVKSVQEPFVSEVAEEISTRICLDPVSAAFQCLDVRCFPGDLSSLATHGKEAIKVLCDHFGEPMEAMNPKTLVRNRCDPKINKVETLAEYELYKVTAYELNSERSIKIKQKLNLVKKKLSSTLTTNANKSKIKVLKSEIADLEASVSRMPLSEMHDVLCVPGRAFLFPNILTLLEMAILCPVGNATPERLFSLLKIVKSRLRNALGDQTLDSLLRIKMESANELEDKELEELVDMFKGYLIDLSKSGEIRIDI